LRSEPLTKRTHADIVGITIFHTDVNEIILSVTG
jgi:hypothetical protein